MKFDNILDNNTLWAVRYDGAETMHFNNYSANGMTLNGSLISSWRTCLTWNHNVNTLFKKLTLGL